MSRKMLFIRPPSLEMGSVAKTRNIHYGTIPYGMLSIITYVNKYKKSDIELRILDLNITPWNTYSEEELERNIKNFINVEQPDVIGLSVMYNHIYPYIEKIGKMIKDINDKIIVIAGGACIMAYYKQILLECSSIDAICYSEGEIPVLQLLEAEDVHETLETHISFLTKKGLLNGKKPKPFFVEHLDDIPLIDFSLINLSNYTTRYTVFRPKEILNEVCLPITTTRGCPYNCIFCIAGDLHGKKVRKTSAKKIIADVKEMKEKYGMNVLSIEDDQSLIDKVRAKEMLRGFAELDIELWMIAGFTVSLIDDETIGLLKKARLQVATLPIESGSPYVLHEIINKPIKLEMVSDVVKSLKKEGILCHANIIIGFPGEKEEHRQESLNFIKNSNIDWCYMFCATALKGSRLYDECAEKGYIDLKQLNVDGYCTSNINTPDFTAEEITKKAYLMNLELNFVYNNRFLKGDYKTAILYFEHVTNKYPDHAFGHYYLAKSYEKLDDYRDKAKFYSDKFYEIINISNEWKEYAEYFKLI
jgi:radical SAM superfamily enzyme YgiQ (UPF0313 family)